LVTGRRQVTELQSGIFGFAVQHWVESFLYDRTSHPLMSSYALETARFIKAHTFGFYDLEPEYWAIVQPFRLSESDSDGFDFLGDSQFKKNFTLQMGVGDVVARVPAGCSVTYANDEQVAAAETAGNDDKKKALNRNKNRTDIPDGTAYVPVKWAGLRDLPVSHSEDLPGAPGSFPVVAYSSNSLTVR
jgi:hypothetical protein